MSKVKSGMYGQLPKLTIGRFVISMFAENLDTHLWIEDTEGGDGGSFDGTLFDGATTENAIKKIYDANF